MAQIQQLTLVINKLDEKKSEVTVSYEIHFSRHEVIAGSTFTERVSLRGEDLVLDNLLDDAFFLQATRAQEAFITRSITKIVANRELDEDHDFRLLSVALRRTDSFYARVTLTPFAPEQTYEDSSVIKGSFGRLG